MNKISVVIPSLNEKLLNWTIDNVKRVEPEAEIIVERGNGVGTMRHQGIMKAKNDVVVVADAHMNFSKQCFQRMASEVVRNPGNLVCVDCRGIDDVTLKNNDTHRYGANFHEIRPGGTTAMPQVFVSSWRRGTERKATHEVPIILGGCYAFSRSHYIDQLGEVWKYHRGWGKSEQMLALMNYYIGGKCVCIPSVWASHLFREKGTRIVENHGFLKRNAMLLLHAFVPETRREQLLNAFCPANRTPDYGIKTLNADGSIKAVRAWLEKHAVKSYKDFEHIFSREKPGANYTSTEKPRECPTCGSKSSKVINTFNIHRRKRQCLDCGSYYRTFSAML